jgi:putative PIN family toxin of toxin-antitoxin system
VKIVCDTNVLVSGILFGGHPRSILQASARGAFENFVSPDILRETHDVLLRPKFGLTARQVDGMLKYLDESFEAVFPEIRVSEIAADPDDDRILEAALAAGADCIISGDTDLLRLKVWKKIRILAPADFVAEFFP